MNNSINMLSPFVLYCQKVIPLAFDESMSYYECLCALYSYLKDTVVPAVNNNAEALEQVQKAMVELKDYVDNYFDNLDIQTEVNNKLDEMAESGELASIIAQYLEAQFIYGFDTIADLKAAETLASGNICRILGKTSYATGDGAFYRVRSLTVYDVIDDDEIVGLTNYPSLVAEKITDYAINHVESEISSLDTRVDALEKPEKWAFIGDSYAEGTHPDTITTAWEYTLIQKMGLSQDQYVIATHGGAGFGNSVNSFTMIVNGMTADNDITDVLIGGGYNDLGFSEENILNGFNSCKTAIANKFPNAKIHVAFIGGTTNSYHGVIFLKVISYQKGCLEYNMSFIPNINYVLYNGTYISSDGIHPTQTGQNEIAKALYQGLNGGYTYEKFYDITITIDTNTWTGNNIALHLYQKNGISTISNYSGQFILTLINTRLLEVNNAIKIGSLEYKTGIIGSTYYSNTYLNLGTGLVRSLGTPAGYFNCKLYMYFDENGDVWLKFYTGASEDHGTYASYQRFQQVQVPVFSVNYPTDML